MQLVLVLAVSLVFGGTQVPLHVRSAQTAAVCTGDYAWADNSKNDSPCLLAAKVNGACHGGNWNVPAINSQNHYDNPNSTSADLCSCSWAAYNFISACTACQGFQNVIQGWSPYKLTCTAAGMLSTTYFPTDKIALPDGTAIPAWAAVDPTQWTSQTFNPSQAKQIANQAKPDLVPGVPTSSSPKSSTPVGAIAGGVVGGVAVLLIAAGVAFYMVRRKRKQQTQTPTNGYIGGATDPGHGRTISDLSQKSMTTGLGLGYSRLDNFSPTQTPLLPTTATLHTHGSSVHSLSYFGSVAGSTTYPATSVAQSMSPHPMSMSPSPPPVNREDIINPYVLPPQPSMQNTPRQASDRKRADGAVVLMYDQPTSPPVNIDDPIASRRPRFNPPMYTPYPEPGPDDSSSQIHVPSSTSRPPHMKTDSADTQRSWDSSTGNTSVVRPGGSGVPLEDVVEQMGLESPDTELTSSGLPSGGTVATGLSGGLENRDVAM